MERLEERPTNSAGRGVVVFLLTAAFVLLSGPLDNTFGYLPREDSGLVIAGFAALVIALTIGCILAFARRIPTWAVVLWYLLAVAFIAFAWT